MVCYTVFVMTMSPRWNIKDLLCSNVDVGSFEIRNEGLTQDVGKNEIASLFSQFGTL